MKFYRVHILANARHTVLFVGVTNDLARRTIEHKTHRNAGSFTARYNVEKLVRYEAHQRIDVAIQRESQLKNWKCEWKVALINTMNPEWKDLSEGGLFG